jgi:hypothetical protein
MVMVVKLTTSFPLTISQCQKKICWLVATMLKLQEPVFVLGTVAPDGVRHFAFRPRSLPMHIQNIFFFTHRIFRRMHGALNIGKKITNCIVCL